MSEEQTPLNPENNKNQQLLELIVSSIQSINGPDALIDYKLNFGRPYITMDRSNWNRMVAMMLRDDAALNFDYLACVSGVDYPEENSMESVYMLYSMHHNHSVIVKVKIPRDDASVMSVKEIWNTADWLERESYDLLGINYEGHPNMTRVLLEDDWEGHPLRKDYNIDKAKLGLD